MLVIDIDRMSKRELKQLSTIENSCTIWAYVSPSSKYLKPALRSFCTLFDVVMRLEYSGEPYELTVSRFKPQKNEPIERNIKDQFLAYFLELRKVGIDLTGSLENQFGLMPLLLQIYSHLALLDKVSSDELARYCIKVVHNTICFKYEMK